MAKASKRPEYLKHTYVCLLAGGTGTRLWPRSRRKTPKQFTPLFKRHTLFQQTIKRVKGLVPLSRVIVITNQNYVTDILHQEPYLPEENIIGEPEKKNTALAMGVAAAWIHHRDPQAVIINLATDHLIDNLPLYHRTLKAAAQTAFIQNKLVSIGIVPTSPHTGLGYIKAGQKITSFNSLPVFQMQGFKEKPDLKTAKGFIKSGRYYWNANNYVYPAELILQEFARLAPGLYRNIQAIKQAISTSKEKKTLKKEYHRAREDSIDYAISEKTDKMVVIPGKFGWSDVGDWKVVYDLSEKDKDGNVVISHGRNGGGHTSIDSKNNMIHFNDQLIATIGVENLIIIDTQDALLICNKDRAEEVKKMVKLLKEKKLAKYL